MTATDELRAMLDARGVEWEASNEWLTSFTLNGYAYTVMESGGLLWVTSENIDGITSAQAIEATLGCGVCE